MTPVPHTVLTKLNAVLEREDIPETVRHQIISGMSTGGLPDPPEQTKLLIMAYGYVHAWLAEDYWTIARIVAELEDCGATMVQVAETFSIAAAALLTDAHDGDRFKATALAARRYSTNAGRTARNQAA